MVLAHSLAAATGTGSSVPPILCTLLLIGAIICTVLVLLALIGVGPWRRGAGVGYGPNHYGPVIGAVVLWVLYVVLC